MKLYRVNNEDEYNWIMQKLENEGYLLGGKSKPTSQTYEEHLEQFSDGWDWFISAEEDSRKVTNYGTREEKEDNEIIEASELMPQKTGAERSRGMKFKIGDKVRVKEKEKIHRNYREREDLEDYFGKTLTISRVFYTSIISSSPVYNAEETGDKKWYEDMIEPIKRKTDAEVMRDIIEPAHYRKGEIDLFESWYRTRPFNEFRAIMESIAERYMKRDKENRVQDISKAIYTLERLKEYEENTK